MRCVVFTAGVLVIAVLASPSSPALGQAGATVMPAEWRTLPLAEFCERAREAVAQAGTNGQLANDVRACAAELLLKDSTYVGAKYTDLWTLYKLAILTAEQRNAVAPRMIPPKDEVAGWSFQKLQTTISTMDHFDLPLRSCGSLAAQWVTTHDIKAMSDPEQLAQLNSSLDWAGERANNFVVSWTGFIKAPHDGDYMFSISPVSINSAPPCTVQQSMGVSIGGRQVINATAANWVSEGGPITLKAGKKTPLRVDFSYFSYFEPNHIGFLPWRFPGVARLSWQGPGVAKQVVPTTVLVLPKEDKPGLAAEYRLTTGDNQTQTFVRTESVIDHVWVNFTPMVPAHPEACAELADRLFAMAMAPEYLTQLETNPSMRHFLLRSAGSSARPLGMLNLARQTAFAELVLARPVLLNSASRDAVFLLYQTCRVDSPDVALRLIGKWAAAHPEADPGFTMDLYAGECRIYYEAAYSLAWQYPPHVELLERDYLALPDGGCSLPVAYILGTAHAMKSRMAPWIEKLDAKLADKTMRGDRRVGWLLARAWAEELRFAHGSNAFARSRDGNGPVHFFLAGQGRLDEACLIAQTEPARLRAYKEVIVRLCGYERFDAARERLEKLASRCSAPESVAALATWRTEIDALQAGFAKLHEKQKADGEKAYWDEIRKRYRGAVAAGNQEAVSRYEQTFSDAGVKP